MLAVARLTGNENRILIDPEEISPNIKNAVIAIEDRRFYQHHGVDLRGMARAAFADFTHHGAVQGGSTITEQFVKNALAAQNNRTVFEKLREAALAYHLERQWSKQKILGEYLNTVYFGNGAYGIESAMRTYFGGPQVQYDPKAPITASNATPAQAALLAGMIASPSGYNPITNQRAALARRNLVLQHMLAQHMISPGQYQDAIIQALPSPQYDQPAAAGLLAALLLDLGHPAARRPLRAGPRVRRRAEDQDDASTRRCRRRRCRRSTATWPDVGPTASLVAIDNKTGEVRAMVGGNDYEHHPFNIATDGHRQPGSAFKPFTLTEALIRGVSPYSVWTSAPVDLPREQARELPRPQLREQVLGHDLAGQRPRLLRQLGLRASSASRWAPTGSRAWPNRMGMRTQGLHEPGDHARRPQGGREPPRDGLRLLDDRQRRSSA